MRDARGWSSTYRTLTGFQVAAIIAAALTAASQNVDANWLATRAAIFQSPVRFLQEWNRVLVPALAAAIVILQGAKKIIGPPRMWKSIRELLTIFREDVYPDRGEDGVHQNRITLFRHRRFCFPWFGRWKFWDGWLVPVIRTGHLTQTRVTTFCAPDRPPSKPYPPNRMQQGVAGIAWNRDQILVVSDLPDLNDADVTDDEFAEYAVQTGVSVDWLKTKPPKARSYCGIPIEASGKRWGVIVLDSHNPQGVKTTPHARKKYELLGRVVRTLF